MTGHLFYGMALVMNAGSAQQKLFPPPPDFPTCRSFPDVGASYITHANAQYEALMNGATAVPHARLRK